MARLDVRLSDELRAAVNSEADRLGISISEFTREALAVYVAWHTALDAIEDGSKPRDLRDPATIARLLGEHT